MKIAKKLSNKRVVKVSDKGFKYTPPYSETVGNGLLGTLKLKIDLSHRTPIMERELREDVMEESQKALLATFTPIPPLGVKILYSRIQEMEICLG